MIPDPQSLEKALGLDVLEPSERAEVLSDMHDLIVERTLIRIVERMDEAQKTAFDELVVREASEEELIAFLEQIPGADEAVQEAVAELRRDILAGTA